MQFVAKPIRVEASQWFPGSRVPGVIDELTDGMPQEVWEKVRSQIVGRRFAAVRNGFHWILVPEGHWVVHDGKKYAVYAEKAFAETYEPVAP